MLKHIKDIRSPIAVAQQKHAARQASVISHETVVTQGHQRTASTSRNAHRPPKLEGQSLATPISSGGSSLHSGWSEGNATLTGDQGVSYAVAIYPYMAEQDDEFDVVV